MSNTLPVLNVSLVDGGVGPKNGKKRYFVDRASGPVRVMVDGKVLVAFISALYEETPEAPKAKVPEVRKSVDLAKAAKAPTQSDDIDAKIAKALATVMPNLIAAVKAAK
jgi:hypothetical protein